MCNDKGVCKWCGNCLIVEEGSKGLCTKDRENHVEVELVDEACKYYVYDPDLYR